MVFLLGALNGINYMFEPDFSKIWDVKVWAAAYGQIFFTLSIGFAIMLAYSSYLPEKSDITNNAFMTVLINCGFSILASIMIFSVLGLHGFRARKTSLTSFQQGWAGICHSTCRNQSTTCTLYLRASVFLCSCCRWTELAYFNYGSRDLRHNGQIELEPQKAATIVIGIGVIVSMAFATNGGSVLS